MAGRDEDYASKRARKPSRIAGCALRRCLRGARDPRRGVSSLFAALGRDPWQALHDFFVKPIETRYGVGELLQKAGPLMLCAVGLAMGYRANVWNIGAEGQLTMGAIFGGGVALAFARFELGTRIACHVRRRSARRHGMGGDSRVPARRASTRAKSWCR